MMHQPPFDAAFVARMRDLLGGEYAAFEAALVGAAPVAIRLHPRKRAPVLPEGDPVPWNAQGRYLTSRPSFTLDPAFHAGAYYVQEASSMFVAEALRQTLRHDPATRPLLALDLCAAPGGKSTLLLDALPPDSLVVCNEAIKSRFAALEENIEKWGYPNVALTRADAAEFAGLEADLILVDAPCSGEGMFRKDPRAIAEWSEEYAAFCALRQARILRDADAALRPGGLLVYSTCTYNPAENEEMADMLIRELDYEPLTLKIPATWGAVETRRGLRFYPHRLRGEGFFISALRKKGEGGAGRGHATRHTRIEFKRLTPLNRAQRDTAASWLDAPEDYAFYQTPNQQMLALPQALLPLYARLDALVTEKRFGLEMGQIKGRELVPTHALALNLALRAPIPRLSLDLGQALRFLRKEPLSVPHDAPSGWTLAQYEELGLGWLKVLPNRANNYLPASRRILMRAD